MNNCSTIRTHRHGFSIIEVMTSIVVAMIGVFGVMVLIPFAVKQAQTGLDSDAATVVARNAYDQFEIAGYRNRGMWLYKATTTTCESRDTMPNGPFPYSIDPLAITENLATADTNFPFNRKSPSTAFPTALEIDSANLRLPIAGVTPSSMSKADAQRLLRTGDDLVFGNATGATPADADLNGPAQFFDSAAGTPLRRQSTGKISWSAIVMPEGQAGSSAFKYRMYILVYKDRRLDETVKELDHQMITARVDQPTGFAAPLSTVTLESGVEASNGEVRKGDWVMLTNRSGPNGVDRQIGFYRVVNIDGGSIADSTPIQLSLDGPNFDFSTADSNGTHVVHLKNVVGVYERSFTPEGNSTWNVSF